MESWQDLLRFSATAVGCPVTDEQLALFAAYRSELLLWNSKMSLLSLKSPSDLPIKHFADSLSALPCLPPKGDRDGIHLLDVGTGAGFPGIPLKLMDPSIRLTLVESSRKKTSFLKQAVRVLSITDVTVLNDRIERIIEGDRQKTGLFDCVISRAAFPLSRLVLIAHYLLATGGVLIAMKGPSSEDELSAALETASEGGLRFLERRIIRLPIVERTRSLILFSKTA